MTDAPPSRAATPESPGHVSGQAAAQAATPGTESPVHVLEVDGRTVHLIGTAHISQRSADDVDALIRKVRPDSVCVELCAPRHQALIRPDAWREMDLFRVVREKRATLLLAHLILSAFQRRLGERLGVKPGSEMLAAIDAARQTGAELVLADREIQITLRRTWGALRWWEKWKLMFQLSAMLVAPPELSESEVESLKSQDMLTQVMDEFARAFPRAKATLIDERDRYLAQRIRTAPGKTLVAVVGAGHLAGILERLHTPLGDPDLSPLTRLPKAGWGTKAMQWAIPALVLGLLGYGFLTADAQVSWEMVKVWFLATGVLAGAGAALALAHPLSILTAVVVAPFTTLHPLLAAGWFAGLTEAIVHKPRVRDFESLPTDVMSLKGFWRNGVTRVLLVVALANLGATIGTLVGIPLVAALLP